MDNSTNEYAEPRTEYIEARKVSMVTMEAKEVPLVKEEPPVIDEEEALELLREKDYIPTSNLLQVRNVAYASREEEQAPPLKVEEQDESKESKPKENKEHRLFYGDVMGGKAEVDRTMEEKTINKQC